MSDALNGMGQTKKAPGEFNLLGPESFLCDQSFLLELLSICGCGMLSIEVRLYVVALAQALRQCLGALALEWSLRVLVAK